MVPAAFVALEKLPLGPTGKVDRRALPTLDKGRPELGRDYVAPRTEVEQTLMGIWLEVLELERVGVNDDFFEVGGHSLLAAQVAARIRRIYEVDFSLGNFLRAPTIAGMAAALEEALVAEISQLSDEQARQLVRGSE